jgi:putative membrane protein
MTASDAGSPDAAPWQRLDPRTLLANLLPLLGAVVQQLWPVLLFGLARSGLRAERVADLGVLAVVFGLGLAHNALRLVTLRFRVGAGRLEVRSGLWRRQTRVVPLDRVQHVEVRQTLPQRLMGLAEVRVETFADADAELSLSALTVADARALADALAAGRRAAPPQVEADPPMVRADLRDLLVQGAASVRLGYVVVGTGVVLELLSSLEPDRARRVTTGLGVGATLAAAVGLFAAGWLAELVATAVRHHGFSLWRTGDALVAEEGLFTRRRVELPAGRVQRVRVVGPWIMRRLGRVYVELDAAVRRRGEPGAGRTLAVVPGLEVERVGEVVSVAMPGLPPDLLDGPMTPAHPRAAARALLQAGTLGALLTAAAVGALGLPGLAALAVAPASMYAAWRAARRQGWRVTPTHVAVRGGWLTQTLVVLDRRRLQTIAVRQGPLLRRWGLAVVTLSAAGVACSLPLMTWDDAWALASRLADSQRALRRRGEASPPRDPAVPAHLV